jgi:murein DD-endopeptidase MepM/ murein hydrolase activator NlpD
MKSIVWGYTDEDITQGFGTYNPQTAGMYDYAAYYGWPAGTHIGLDVGVSKGTKIFAAEDGEVIQAGMSDSFRPKPVWIKEKDGDTAIYGHLWTNEVDVGDTVKAGDLLGTSGEQTKRGTMEPDGTGAHIHFELRSPDNTAIDPTQELTGASGPLSEGSSGISKWLIIGGIGVVGIIALVVIKK